MTQITKGLRKQQPNYAQDNLQALIKLFNNLDYTAAKVAHLKASVRKEEQTIARMQSWLSQYEKQVHGIFSTGSPSLSQTRALAAENAISSTPQIEGTAKKLTLARSFVSEQLRQSQAKFVAGRNL
jgi:hypothetical protein